jgi:cotJC protein
LELCRIACFIFIFLCFCSYAIVAGKGLSYAKWRVFKGFQLCCSYEVAPEQKARVTYDNILRLSDDPDVSDVIKFLRAREIVHFQRFGEGLRLAKDRLDEKNVYYVNPSFDQ